MNQQDITLCKAFLQPAVDTFQLSADTRNEIIEALKNKLHKKEYTKPEFLTMSEAVQLLKCSRPTIYKMIYQNKLKKHMVCGTVRFLMTDLMKAVECSVEDHKNSIGNI